MAVSKKKKVAPKAKPKLKAKPKAASKPKVKTQSAGKPKVKAKVPANKVKAKSSSPKVKAKKLAPQVKAKKSSPASVSKKRNFSHVFTPLDDRILVDVLPPETKTAGGLFIPDIAQNRQNRGVVVAVGPGRRNKKAKLRPMDVQMGDQIIYAEYAGTAIEVLGQEVLILREDEVIAIVNK